MFGRRAPFQFDHPNFRIAKGIRRQVVEVPHALAGMTVDGVQAPWPDRPSHRITKASFVHGLDPDAIEADFWLCWDENYLYLYIDVKDPTPRKNLASGRGIWYGDAVEVFFGAQELDRGGELLFSDRQILISAGLADEPVYYWWNLPKQYETKVVVRTRSDQQGYVMEAGIPFEALGVKPAPGLEFRFDIGIDDSATGTNRLRQFMWNGTAENSTVRSAWGRARLSE